MINSLKTARSALKGINADTLKIGGQNILILLRFEPNIFLRVSDTLKAQLKGIRPWCPSRARMREVAL